MPLRCITTDNRSIQAFDLSEADWEALRAENRRNANLRMPCCDAQVIVKTSPLGVRFFAHKAKTVCNYKPETEHHIRLKEAVVRAAKEAGWTAATEVAGLSTEGEPWIADVLATSPKGSRIAFEVQWSKQSDNVTIERQKRYQRSGVRCMWLFRQEKFPSSTSLPAARISNASDTAYVAHIPIGHAGPEGKSFNAAPLNHFLTSVFRRSFRFGVAVGDLARLDMHTATYNCYRKCKGGRIVINLELWVGPHSYDFTIDEIEGHPEVISFVRTLAALDRRIGEIKLRTSGKGPSHERYLSNGCVKCDNISGRFYEPEYWHTKQLTQSQSFQLTAAWKALIEVHYPDEARWGVHL